LKLKRKVAAGASFVITQMGFDVRKFDELRRFMDREGLKVPLLGTVFIPTTGLARTLCKGEIPGCILPDRLLERMEQEAMSDDKEAGPRLERTARLVSILKGIGYEGVHLSGPGLKYSHVRWVLSGPMR
jgi:methylenetetrahydrofolate reductase (NADPH)